MNIQMITIHPRIYLLISFIHTNTDNWITTNHPRCKHHPKSPPQVTSLCLQSRTTIHAKIHPYTLVHKSLPRKPAIWLSLNFFIHISSTHKHNLSHHLQKLHKFLKIWQRHVTLLKTQDGDVPTTRNILVNNSTLITVQVHYTAIINYLSLQNRLYLIYWPQ